MAEERYREGKCLKLGQHPLAEGKVLIRDRQAKPQCVGCGITNDEGAKEFIKIAYAVLLAAVLFWLGLKK